MPRSEIMQIDEFTLNVTYKNIKNSYVRLIPQLGQILLSVPLHATRADIEDLIRVKRSWILQHLKAAASDYEAPRSYAYVQNGCAYLWGKCYTLRECTPRPCLRADFTDDECLVNSPIPLVPYMYEELVKNRLRSELELEIGKIWESTQRLVGVQAQEWRVRDMHSRWGTCNINKKRIWLSLHLAQHSKECLRYVLIHELVHLLVKSHNAQFRHYMSQFMPEWSFVKARLNRGLRFDNPE